MGRIFMSPGPIFEPEGLGEDWWRTARALFSAGMRKGDIVHNTFSYHLTPGAWILDSGARALGCAVIAAGPGNTEQQLDIIQYLKPTAYVGVPDYLKILLDKAKEAGKDASSFRKALVGGAALFPSLRAEYKARGIDTYQTYATADLDTLSLPDAGWISVTTTGMDAVTSATRRYCTTATTRSSPPSPRAIATNPDAPPATSASDPVSAVMSRWMPSAAT